MKEKDNIPSLDEIWRASQAHFRNDELFQQDFRAFMEECKPMLKVFTENNVYKMKFKEETSTIVFWVKSTTSVLVLLGILWGILKYLLTK